MPGPTPPTTPDPTSSVSSPSSFSSNLAQAQQVMNNMLGGEGDDKSENKEDKDPMLEYGKALMKLVETLSGGSDTATDPMSMISDDKGASSDLDDFDMDAGANNDLAAGNTASQGADLDQASSMAMAL